MVSWETRDHWEQVAHGDPTAANPTVSEYTRRRALCNAIKRMDVSGSRQGQCGQQLRTGEPGLCHSVIKEDPIPKKTGDPSGRLKSAERIRSSHQQDVSDHHPKSAKVVPLLRPGTFVTLENQPSDLPPFQLIHCRGGRCWVRQQAWGQYVHWEVEHDRLRAA